MILIFSNNKNNFAARLNEISEVNEFVHSQYNDLFFVIDQAKKRIGIQASGRPLEKFDLIYLRRSENFYKYCSAIVSFLVYKNIPFIDGFQRSNAGKGKLFQMFELACHGLPVPKTLAFSSEIVSQKYADIAQELNSPFIMKNSLGKKGQLNYLVKNERSFKKFLSANPDTFFIFQEFIPNHFDYRVVTLGGQAMVLKKRQRVSKTTHLNNTSQGATVEIFPGTTDPKLELLAKKATDVLKVDIAGVDIVVSDVAHNPYILEVNKAPEITDPASLVSVRDYLLSLKKGK